MTSLAGSGDSSHLGADTGAMRRAAYELDAQADRIRRNGEAMTAEVNQIWWRGPDAERFRGEWNGHRDACRKIVGELCSCAAQLRQEAARQEAISAT